MHVDQLLLVRDAEHPLSTIVRRHHLQEVAELRVLRDVERKAAGRDGGCQLRADRVHAVTIEHRPDIVVPLSVIVFHSIVEPLRLLERAALGPELVHERLALQDRPLARLRRVGEARRGGDSE